MTASQSIRSLAFGPPARRLFGIFHPPIEDIAAKPGVVLCNAFGQEAIRAQRMMRVLGERLARNGHPVLRFDYFGTGDSLGDDIDGELDGWALDVLEADRELRAASGTLQTTWIGMRLGGTIALRAAAQSPVGLARLMLWDPVLDGRRYLEHLRQRHVATLEAAYSVPRKPSYTEQAKRDPDRFHDEAMGFALSAALRGQLLALRPGDFRWPARPPSIVAITDPADGDGTDLAHACAADPSRVTVIDLQHGTPWTADTAGNTSLVPANALMRLVQLSGSPA